jgi:replicative DNA helicase Mcm
MARTELFALYLESKTDDSFDYNDAIQSEVISRVKPSMIPNHVKKLLGSVAPHIYGNTVIKLALLLQLVGAPSIMVEGSRVRGDIHMLLLGDASTGKSEFGRTFLKLIPKSVYVQADAATGVGLTSAVMPPDDMGSRRIELGALPLANGSGVFVEEIDKLKNREDLNNLSSALDDVQVIVPRKGGFMSELPTRAPCFFAANPHGGADWDPSKSIHDQTKFPTWFFSRMDLIWITRKPRDKALHEKILQHRTHFIMNAESEKDYNTHRKKTDPFSPSRLNEMKTMIENDNYNGTYNYEYLINEIKYLKTHYHPILPQDSEAFKMIDEFIINAQPMVVQQKDGTVVSYTVVDNRTKNSVVRLALASARLHRREVVSMADVKLAITLVKESIETRKIEAPSLVVGENGSSAGDGMFTNPKVLNNLLKLTESFAKLENDRYTVIMKTIANRAKAFNKAIFKFGTEICDPCKGMGMIMDIDTRRQTRCNACNATGKQGKLFYMSYIEDYLLNQIEKTPFTVGPKGQTEIQMFVQKYTQMGWIKQKAVDTYEIYADLTNDIIISRGIQNFIRYVTGLLYEKEMSSKLDETKNKTGGSSVGMSDVTTADKLR